jgi:hypothetical protein
VLHAVRLWCKEAAGRDVVFHVDNQALVTSLNSGRCHHRSTQTIIRTIYPVAIEVGAAEDRGFSFHATWLSSEENARADTLSRHPSGSAIWEPSHSILPTTDDYDDDASAEGDEPVGFDPSHPPIAQLTYLAPPDLVSRQRRPVR